MRYAHVVNIHRREASVDMREGQWETTPVY